DAVAALLRCTGAVGPAGRSTRPCSLFAEVSTMAQVAWQVAGDYFETCSCAYLCPCITSNMAAAPSKGECFVALAFHVDQGRYGGTALDGLNFPGVAPTPGA